MEKGGAVRQFRRPILWAAAAFAAFAGMILLGRIATTSEPAPHQMNPGYAFAIFGAFAAWVICTILTLTLLWSCWRAHRRAHGHFTPAEKAVIARQNATEAAYRNGWDQARAAATHLASGRDLPAVPVFDVVLRPGENVRADVVCDYARYYGGDGTYRHIGGIFLGSPGFVAGGLAITALGNAARRNRARQQAVAQWREWQRTRVLATDQRLICHAAGRWLSFDYAAVIAFHPDPRAYQMVLEFPDTSPLLLTGPAAPLLAIVATSRLHGPAAVHEHPALAALRAG